MQIRNSYDLEYLHHEVGINQIYLICLIYPIFLICPACETVEGTGYCHSYGEKPVGHKHSGRRVIYAVITAAASDTTTGDLGICPPQRGTPSIRNYPVEYPLVHPMIQTRAYPVKKMPLLKVPTTVAMV